MDRGPRRAAASSTCSGTQVGGFFTYGNDAEDLIARMKDVHDGAIPSANATAAVALARLSELTGEISFLGRRAKLWRSWPPHFHACPAVFPGAGAGRRLPRRAEAPGGRRLLR